MAKAASKNARRDSPAPDGTQTRTRAGLMLIVVLLAAVGFFVTRSGERKATQEEEVSAAAPFDEALHMRGMRLAAFGDALRAVWGSAVTVAQPSGGKVAVTLAAGTRTADFYNNNPRLLDVKNDKLFSIRHDDAREILKAEFSVKGGVVQVPTDVLFSLAKNFALLPQNTSDPDGI